MTEKPRHARVSADFWDHPSTEWMHPLHRDVFIQACAANSLGLLELPMARIAKRSKSTVEQIATAMHQMDDEGVAVWWRDLGIFWVVNAPERNVLNANMWRSANKLWRAQPKEVRDRIVSSWPQVEGNDSPNGAPNGTENGSTNDYPRTRSNQRVSVSASGGVGVDPASRKSAHEDLECARVQEGLTRIKPTGRLPLLYRDERVRELVRAGASADEILATVQRHADRVEAGEDDAKTWAATYVFSGYYDRLREQGVTPTERPW